MAHNGVTALSALKSGVGGVMAAAAQQHHQAAWLRISLLI